jgi:prepilin-type N-terminal cleavage/methylation domain-containing protein
VGNTASRRAGFSLVELLVVTGLVALLAALCTPALSRAREKSRQAVCVSNLRHLGQAQQMYVDEFGRLPNAPGSGYLLWDGTEYLLHGQLAHAYGRALVRSCFCPSSRAFPVDSADTGSRNFGVPGQITAGGYLARGRLDGAPDRLTTDLRVLVADLHDPAVTEVNHRLQVNALYSDGSVRQLNVPETWRLDGPTAWAQLESLSVVSQ